MAGARGHLRDLTRHYKDLRQNQSTYSDDAAAADLEANNEPIDVPRWFAYKDSVESLFASVDKDITKLKACELASTDAFASNDLERNELMRSISSNLKRAEQNLRLVHSKTHFSKNACENTLRQNIKQFFSQRLFEYTSRFQATQKQHLSTKVQSDNYKREATSAFVQVEEEEMTDSQVNMLATQSQLYNSRHKEIVELAKSVQEISAMFNELGRMVVEQGTVLDRIDYHCEVALQSTKEGVKSLQEAEKEQKKDLGVKFIAILTAVVTFLACFFIIKVTKF